MKMKKIISLILSLIIFCYSLVPYFVAGNVLAQEEGSTPPASEQPTSEPSVQPTTSPEETVLPQETASPVAESEPSPTGSTESTPTPTPSQTPQPTPTIPPYWSDEYDVWKAEQEKIEEQQEAREAEWEAHENDADWIAAHGGNEWYFVSGAWQKDEDARIAAEEAAAQEAARKAAEEAALNQSEDTPGIYPLTGSAYIENLDTNPCAQDPLVGTQESLAQTASGSSEIVNDNCLAINNDQTAGGYSGENQQFGIDGNVSTQTGDASGTGTLSNVGNINTTAVTASADNQTSGNQEGDSLNIPSDPDSLNQESNTNSLEVGEEDTLTGGSQSEDLVVNSTNEALVNNTLNVEATSGQNIQTCNDGDATLTTGDLELIANMLNILNLNITGSDFLHLIVNIFGTLNGNLDLDDIASALGLSSEDELEIIARGSESSNESVTQDSSVGNNNSAVVNNDLNVTGVTGANNVSGNDGEADVVTGRIKILANLMNFINANFSGEKWSFIMVNIFGKLTGDIILPDTADYLNSESTANTDTDTPTASVDSGQTGLTTNQNDLALTNNINANGISGENSQVGNDGTNNVNPGEVDVVTRLVNFLNFNITGNNWVFLVVNVFGRWMGKIVNFAGNNLDAPTDGSFAALKVGENTASETNDSTSGAGTQLVDNTNSAVVNNQINIDGISGGNNVNQNDGNTSLTTGWVDIDANLLNIINMNVTGRSWMIVFLNIFGDFFGNLFFGQPPVSPTQVSQAGGAQVSASQENFTMGETPSSSDQNNQNQSVSTTSTVTAFQNNYSGGNTIAATIRVRKIVRRLPQAGRMVLSYHATTMAFDNQPSQYYSLTIFGKYVKIPVRSINKFIVQLKKIFPRLAFEDNLLTAVK